MSIIRAIPVKHVLQFAELCRRVILISKEPAIKKHTIYVLRSSINYYYKEDGTYVHKYIWKNSVKSPLVF
jgi:hypothetical protein